MKPPARKILRSFGQVEGELRTVDSDFLSFTIIDVQDIYSAATTAKFSREALQDADYLQFRAKLKI